MSFLTIPQGRSFEVVDSLSLVMGSSFDDVLRIKEEKKEARGGFSDRIFLEYVTEFKQGEK